MSDEKEPEKAVQRLNCDIPIDLYRAAEKWAAENESSVAGCVRLALRRFLATADSDR